MLRRTIAAAIAGVPLLSISVFAGDGGPIGLQGHCVRESAKVCPPGTLSRATRNEHILICTNNGGVFTYRGPCGPVRADNSCRGQSFQKYPMGTMSQHLRARMIGECERNGGVFRG